MNIQEYKTNELNKLNKWYRHSLDRLNLATHSVEHDQDNTIERLDTLYKNNMQIIENIDQLINQGKNYVYPQMVEDWEDTVFSLSEDLMYITEIKNAIQLMQQLSRENKKQNSVNLSSVCNKKIVDNLIIKFSKFGVEYCHSIYGNSIPQSTLLQLDEISKRNQEFDSELVNAIS